MDKCQSLLVIIKRDFFRLFWKAWGTAFIEENMFFRFKNTGLYPFNLKVVIKRFRVKEEERLLSNKSIESVLKADDWRRINILIKKIINKKAVKKA